MSTVPAERRESSDVSFEAARPLQRSLEAGDGFPEDDFRGAGRRQETLIFPTLSLLVGHRLGACLVLCLVGCGAAPTPVETPSSDERVLLRIQTPVGTHYTVLSDAQLDLGPLGQVRARTAGEIVADAHDESHDTTTFTFRVGSITMLDAEGRALREPTALPGMVLTTTLGADGSLQEGGPLDGASSQHTAMLRAMGGISTCTYPTTPLAVGDRWTGTTSREVMGRRFDCEVEYRLGRLRDGHDGRIAEIEWRGHCGAEAVPSTDEDSAGLARISGELSGTGEVLVSDALHGHWRTQSETTVTFVAEGEAPREILRTVNAVELAIGSPL